MMEQIHIRSRDKQNSIHHLRASKPQVTKLSRHHHIRRSYNNQHENQFKNKSKTIRTKRHVSLSSNNLWHNNNSETKITHNTASDITRDDEMDLSMRYLGTKPFKLSSLDETVSSHNHQKVQIRDAWPNWTNRTAVLRWNTTGETIAGVVGQFGNASNQLNVPFGLTMDWSNTLYIADWSNHRVQKYLRNSSFGQTVAGQATGSYNTTSSFLYYPGDVAVDWNSNVYVADTFNNRIQLWTNGSSTGMTVAGTGSIGNGSNELARPYALTRDPNTGTLYISDTFNNRVMCYLSGALSGSIVAGGLGSGINNTQLSSPFGIYFDSLSNSLIIANGNANNIVRWTLGASSWTLLAGNANGMSGNTSTELNLPMDVTLDPMGNMYVVERLNHRIQFFPMGETVGTTIAGLTGISGSNSILLNQPMSVTLDSQLNLYVADTFNSRIQKFVRY
ncbi:unnamed protein product [Adineta steineri]|uniref:NHL repeat containing protein n=1 Tax=Adineta steineri TaxID=433720 RepID=A0A815QWB6_9BILA|nr:unnamed protein product [Adineta steineri]CAF3988481.1 unnamed protein product [Adineta steineri]